MMSPQNEPSGNDETQLANTTAREFSAETHLFGRYRPVRELGRGGMGVVWLAVDEVLGIEVALKVLPPELVASEADIDEFRKEVLRGISLTHPGIVRVYSFERDAKSAAIVMEYVDGETLADMKAQQPGGCFDCAELLPILEQLAPILDYAHGEAKIAHRDLKPRNLMLTSQGRLKVADFGIASSLTDTMSRLSVRLDACGTPPYMSPQQVMGERPSPEDDIYSVGATFYELITGKPPFYRGHIVSQVFAEPAPSMTARRKELGVTGKAPIPDRWEKMIAACLSKEPGDRPMTGATLVRLVDPIVPATTKFSSGFHAPANPPTGRAEAKKTTSRLAPIAPPTQTTRRVLTEDVWAPPVPRSEPWLTRFVQKIGAIILAGAVAAGALYFYRHHEPQKTAAPTATPPPQQPARPSYNSSLQTSTLQPAPDSKSSPRKPR